ncbi:unnamed protein product [Clonostachys rosea f. rosea IK726]|uniref:Uncharacterized protein n=1 Tax=Clonostachys rosea f. rosea IK726 TaxID=1349383 RepID=A0ACA9U5E0_BIOOC|nr:unnamed protein product [Clonostachys rosea f. rosea IK726]
MDPSRFVHPPSQGLAPSQEALRSSKPPNNDLDDKTFYGGPNSMLLNHVGGSTSDGSAKENFHHDEVATWEPFWLRRTVLSIFLAWFFCCAAILLVLLLLSKRDGGIGQGHHDLVYVYRFVPAAVLTLVAVFLSRVELQVFRYLPWAFLQTHDGLNSEVYTLDYTSMILPKVLFWSVQRRHFFVTLAAVSTIMARVQIILSPALFQLEPRLAWDPVNIRLMDSFAVSENVTNTTAEASFYHRKAMLDFDMEYPFGVASQGAYQMYEASTRSDSTRGTRDHPLRLTVDGLFMDTQCAKMRSYDLTSEKAADVTGRKYTQSGKVISGINITLDFQFDSCDKPVRTNTVIADYAKIGEAWWAMLDVEQPPSCSSLPQRHTPFVYYGCWFDTAGKNGTMPPKSSQCAAVMCSSTAWTSKVAVEDYGSAPELTVPPQQEDTQIISNPWAMLAKSIPTLEGGWGTSNAASNVIMGPLDTLYEVRGKVANRTLMSNYQNEVLKQAVTNVTEMFWPLVAHYHFRQDRASEIQGSSLLETEALRVNQGVCIAMLILFCLSMLIIVCIIRQSAEVSQVWHRNPATILGSMAFLQGKTDIAQPATVSRTQGQEDDRIWGHTDFSMLVLRSRYRAIFTVYVLALIVALSTTLAVSQRSDGLGTIGNDVYIPFVWRVLPALAMFGVALYTTTVDFVVRDLAILSKLATSYCTAAELDTSLLDMLGFRALYHSFRLRVYTVSVSQTLAAICAFLVAFTSLLFNPETVAGHNSWEFPQTSWFGDAANQTSLAQRNTFAIVKSLVLTQSLSNFTYPKSTYGDLLFPTIDFNSSDWGNQADHSIRLDIPAAKLAPTCSKVPQSNLNITVKDWTKENVKWAGEPPSFYVTIIQNNKCAAPPVEYTVNNKTEYSETRVSEMIQLGQAAVKNHYVYMASVLPTPETADATLCGPKVGPNWVLRTYFWGNFSADTASFTHLSAWKCNYTWVEVPTSVQMIQVNGELQIDHGNPPVPDNDNVRPWDPPFTIPKFGYSGFSHEDEAFPDIDSQNTLVDGFSPHFATILEPFGKIKAEEFGTLGAEDRILDALHYNLGFVGTQLANKQNRFAINETSAAESPLLPVKADLVDEKRRRLVQSPSITYVIISILALVAIVNIWALVSAFVKNQVGEDRGWFLDMELKGLVPDGFGSIATTSALLHSSNSLQRLPEAAHMMSPSQLYQCLAETRYQKGWFLEKENDEKHYTVGVTDDDKFQYLGKSRSMH